MSGIRTHELHLLFRDMSEPSILETIFCVEIYPSGHSDELDVIDLRNSEVEHSVVLHELMELGGQFVRFLKQSLVTK